MLGPLRSVRVWRFGLYYFLVFGCFVALSRPLAVVGMQTPQQCGARGHLNRAVESEADERDAAGKESGSQRNQPFETVVGNGEPLQLDAASNMPGPVDDIEQRRLIHSFSIGARCIPSAIWYSSAAFSDRGTVGCTTDFADAN